MCVKIRKMSKITFEQKDEISYVVKGTTIGKKLQYPKDYDINQPVSFEYVLENGAEKKSKIPISLLQKKDLTKSDKRNWPTIELLKDFYDDIDHIEELLYGFNIKFKFSDVTDYEFNKYGKISQDAIKSPGLWISNGIRRIEIEFNEAYKELTDDTQLREVPIEYGVFFSKKDNHDLINPIRLNVKKTRDKKKIFINLDTDEIAKEVGDTQHFDFYGYLDIQIKKANEPYSEDTVENLRFPISMRFINPKLLKSQLVNQDIVSIDFGTSSTCIAYDEGKKMVAFTDNPQNELDYENPTALAIYNWDKIFETWDNYNQTFPHFNRSTHRQNQLTKNDHFEYGYGVTEELSECSAKYTEAVITNLKSLPKKLFAENAKEIVKPFLSGKITNIKLTSSIKDENQETFNPIAFYGYLIGRNLNSQIKNKIYTKYRLTIPVKFNSQQRKIIKESLEYGIKRSIPHMLKETLSVEMGRDESVALIGAVRKHINPKGKPILFAVFDFGGGTLDFAFGMSREASSESKLIENELEKHRIIIEIFKTGGELVGGETLINALSYYIYTESKVQMKEKNIPIIIPDNEEIIEHFPVKLTNASDIAKVNLKLINEFYSRRFFKGNGFDEEKEIELFDIENNPIQLKMDVNADNADDFINQRIKKLIENFKGSINKAFLDEEFKERYKTFGIDEFNIGDVKIFQAGNACKAKWINSNFEQIFPEFINNENIIFVKDESKKITPKNAVAKGALKLTGAFGIYNWEKAGMENTKMPLDYNVGIRDDCDDSFEIILPKGCKKNWQKLTMLEIEEEIASFSIYYTSSENVDDCDDNNVKHKKIIIEGLINEDKRTVYIKPDDQYSIKYVLGSSQNGADEESFNNKELIRIVNLD